MIMSARHAYIVGLVGLVALSACGANDAKSLAERIQGVPVDVSQVERVIASLEHDTGRKVSDVNEYTFLKPVKDVDGAQLGHFSLFHIEVSLSDDLTGEPTTCVFKTSLAHEIVHSLFGDPNHDDPKLWYEAGGLTIETYTKLSAECP